MSRNWEDTFTSWGASPSQAERDKCDNAERAIRKAISSHTGLAPCNISVFAQGSYRNRTNVRADSDVDICVCSRDAIFYDLPDGMLPSDFDIIPTAPYSYPQFKNEMERALRAYFGTDAVARGNKAVDIHENTYRIAADAVSCFEYRRCEADGSHLVGTSFLSDTGEAIINWPDQNYEHGVAKNEHTSRRFKAVVRILKHLRNEMREQGYQSAGAASSFLIESLVWNVPDEGFGHSTLTADIRWALAHLFNETREDSSCEEWGEINELKYLFRLSQPWTREQANLFLHEAWEYIGFS